MEQTQTAEAQTQAQPQAPQAAPAGGLTAEQIQAQIAQSAALEQMGEATAKEATASDGWHENDDWFFNSLNADNINTPAAQEAGQGQLTPSPQQPAQTTVAHQQLTPDGQHGTTTPQMTPDATTLQTQQAAQQQNQPSQQAQSQQAPPEQSIEQLHAELEQLKDAKTFMDSNEYRQARLVVEELKRDPVNFYREYLPQFHEQIQQQDAIRSASSPQDYAKSYMEQQLQTKYGEDFVYDPSESGVPGSKSFDYLQDRTTLYQDGLYLYQQEAASAQKQAEQQKRDAFEVGARVATGYGIASEQFNAVVEAAEKLNLTPEANWEMILLYMDKHGHLGPFKGPAQQTPQNGLPSQTAQQVAFRPDAVPSPGVQTIVGQEAGAQPGSDLAEIAHALSDPW